MVPTLTAVLEVRHSFGPFPPSSSGRPPCPSGPVDESAAKSVVEARRPSLRAAAGRDRHVPLGITRLVVEGATPDRPVRAILGRSAHPQAVQAPGARVEAPYRPVLRSRRRYLGAGTPRAGAHVVPKVASDTCTGTEGRGSQSTPMLGRVHQHQAARPDPHGLRLPRARAPHRSRPPGPGRVLPAVARTLRRLRHRPPRQVRPSPPDAPHCRTPPKRGVLPSTRPNRDVAKDLIAGARGDRSSAVAGPNRPRRMRKDHMEAARWRLQQVGRRLRKIAE